MTSYKELLRFIWTSLRTQKWIFFFIFLLDAITWPCDSLIWPYILNLCVNIFTQFDADRAAAWADLTTPVIWAIILSFSVEISSRTMGFLLAKVMPKLQADLRMNMFDHVTHHSPRYFNENFAGSLSNKITDMISAVESLIQHLFWPIVPGVVACIASTVVFWNIHPIFAYILGIWIILHLGVAIKFLRPIDIRENQHGEARSTLLGKIVDSFTNNFAVNLFHRFSYEKILLAPFQKKEMDANFATRRYTQIMFALISLVFFFGNLIGINGTLLYLWLHDHITTGQLIQVFTISWSLSIVVWMASNDLSYFFRALGLALQAHSVMRDPQDLGDKPVPTTLKVTAGAITFKNVHFRYGEHRLFENKQVHIRGGEKVGLVGYTGAGKSTFVNLILRLFPLQKGQIFIDGQNIADVTLASLRRQIALIPQDPVLFHRTLYENIAYGNPDATSEQIYHAAKLAHCDLFIRNLPQGYDAKVGERGTKLSGGEKQRIAIARAILADTPILILDEATSSLDSLTERLIQDSLDHIMTHRTTLVIAHRLSTLSRMDRILVFDKGKIVEEGTHTDLLAHNNLYAKLWNMQVGGFLPNQPI